VLFIKKTLVAISEVDRILLEMDRDLIICFVRCVCNVGELASSVFVDQCICRHPSVFINSL